MKVVFRKILGYAAFAAVGIIALKLAFGLLGFLWQIAWTILVLAFLGFLLYLVLRVVSPSAAEKMKDAINGSNGAATQDEPLD